MSLLAPNDSLTCQRACLQARMTGTELIGISGYRSTNRSPSVITFSVILNLAENRSENICDYLWLFWLTETLKDYLKVDLGEHRTGNL